MGRALKLAANGKGSTSPNPMVGVVLEKDGRVVGEGWHRRAGGPHAEVEAVRCAGDEAQGATLYVNLEPCVHFGRTPPCTDLIIERGVRRVVCAMGDPNPVVAGRGIAQLRAAGIEVVCGVLKEQAARLNEAYLKFITTGLPFVTLKLAQTLDGRIAAPGGSSRWVTGEAARQRVHQLRSEADAVLVGTNTVLADDPQLTVRLVEGRDPLRIVLDGRLRIPPTAKVFSDGHAVLVTTEESAREHARELKERGLETWTFPGIGGSEGVRLVLARAGRAQITSLLVEGGGQVAASLLKAGMVDRLAVFIAPRILGGGVAGIGDLGIADLGQAVVLDHVEIERLGEDLLYLCTVRSVGWDASGAGTHGL